jgi:hypothetical protein
VREAWEDEQCFEGKFSIVAKKEVEGLENEVRVKRQTISKYWIMK